MAAESAAEATRLEAVRTSGLRGRTNKSSEHYNIITLDYHNTPEGQSLQFKVGRVGSGGLEMSARVHDAPIPNACQP